jgi:hypothetical protein
MLRKMYLVPAQAPERSINNPLFPSSHDGGARKQEGKALTTNRKRAARNKKSNVKRRIRTRRKQFIGFKKQTLEHWLNCGNKNGTIEPRHVRYSMFLRS